VSETKRIENAETNYIINEAVVPSLSCCTTRGDSRSWLVTIVTSANFVIISPLIYWFT